jgi:hypothetical protein
MTLSPMTPMDSGILMIIRTYKTLVILFIEPLRALNCVYIPMLTPTIIVVITHTTHNI